MLMLARSARNRDVRPPWARKLAIRERLRAQRTVLDGARHGKMNGGAAEISNAHVRRPDVDLAPLSAAFVAAPGTSVECAHHPDRAARLIADRHALMRANTVLPDFCARTCELHLRRDIQAARDRRRIRLLYDAAQGQLPSTSKMPKAILGLANVLLVHFAANYPYRACRDLSDSTVLPTWGRCRRPCRNACLSVCEYRPRQDRTRWRAVSGI